MCSPATPAIVESEAEVSVSNADGGSVACTRASAPHSPDRAHTGPKGKAVETEAVAPATTDGKVAKPDVANGAGALDLRAPK